MHMDINTDILPTKTFSESDNLRTVNCSLYSPFCRVLNSDNMSIVGVTIDYGPYGFLDYYDPNYLSQSSGKWDSIK